MTKIPEPVPLSPGELATLQKRMADEAKFEKESAYQASPAGQKEYLMSKQVDAVARDAEGNIVAKIYKDGSLMCDDGGLALRLSKCNSNAEKIHLLEKNSNAVVSDYTKEKVTDFDLLKEEFAQIEKRLSIHPELRALYAPDIVELQRRTLAA
jgi:formylmethanofuran:tetrahydromethanopterin formyltransferase